MAVLLISANGVLVISLQRVGIKIFLGSRQGGGSLYRAAGACVSYHLS